MKTIVLCGGKGTRLDRHGALVPKALFKIGNEPLILHLFRIYQQFGLDDFVLSLGYLSEEFGKFFGREIDEPDTDVKSSQYVINEGPQVSISLVDTGIDTNTGGRVKKLEPMIQDQTFCVTYGLSLIHI